MGDNLVPAERVVEGLQGFRLQVEIFAIIMHEADEPNPGFSGLMPEASLRSEGDLADMPVRVSYRRRCVLCFRGSFPVAARYHAASD
jgi:hypothetical protein